MSENNYETLCLFFAQMRSNFELKKKKKVTRKKKYFFLIKNKTYLFNSISQFHFECWPKSSSFIINFIPVQTCFSDEKCS
jgi:hypothetical protein